MPKYRVEVLQDGSTKQKLFTVETGNPVDVRLLQVAGLVLDGGYSDDEIAEMLPSAAMYVGVIED